MTTGHTMFPAPRTGLALEGPGAAGAPRRRLRAAVLAVLAIAAALGVGAALQARGGPAWAFASTFASTLTLGLLLLAALAAAARIRPSRVPRWVPFAAAALAAAVAASALDWGLARALSDTTGFPWPRGRMTLRDYAWLVTPENVLVATLAAFAWMRAQDAARRNGQLRSLQRARIRAAHRAYEARLAALKARVEPRFLFDTLSDIEALYATDPALAARALDDLIAYLHAVLPATDAPATTLAAELTLARTWLSIMRARSGGRLAFSVIGPERAPAARMPPMVLLPLVQHAVESDAGGTFGPRTVAIDAAAAAGRLRVVVSVAGPPLAPAAAAPVADEVRAHLRALYGDEASLALAAGDGGESRAILEIPLVRT